MGHGGCINFATAVHELGHAIGFYHEHNRPDRDDYVDIKYDNVAVGARSQFDKSSESNLLDLGYDHASIMHYSKSTFSSNNLDTIKASVPFGNAEELSPLDIAKTNALYSCKCAF